MVEHLRWFAAKVAQLARVAPDRRSALRIYLLTAWLWSKKRTGRRGGRRHVVRVSDHGRRVEIQVGEYTDLEVLREVFAGDTYPPFDDLRPAVILDVGSNIGASVKLWRSRFPSAEIHAVEPDPTALATLRANVADDPRVTVHACAVGGTSGRARFFSSQHGWASSLLGDRRRAIPGRWITVEVLCLDDLLARIGHERVGLLKLDIEGAEWELFASCRLRDRATVVMGELHDREQRREDALSPGLDDLSVRFTDPPHATTFVAFRNYV